MVKGCSTVAVLLKGYELFAQGQQADMVRGRTSMCKIVVTLYVGYPRLEWWYPTSRSQSREGVSVVSSDSSEASTLSENVVR